MRWALCVTLIGCSFSPSAAPHSGDDDGPMDAPVPGIDARVLPAPLHLADRDGSAGDADLTLSGNVTINTSDLTVTGATPMFDVKQQLANATEVAVLHVRAFTVASGANVRVVGSRPLIVVAGGVIEIAGLVDAGGHITEAGAGGGGSITGGPGTHVVNSSTDSGGGGGGGASPGAPGGTVTCSTPDPGGAGGDVTGDAAITILVGGSSGGEGVSGACDPNAGGAGGGAVQLTSTVSVHIAASGAINVGGGGGTGGTDCGNTGDGNSGAGGGAGGAIVLQAPSIVNEGTLAANGGGGGGSGTGSFGGNSDGDDGGNGQASTAIAAGGGGHGSSGNAGGAGGVGGTDALQGVNASCGDNGGGGGGGVGWIAASQGFSSTGTVSPSPSVTLPL